MSELRKLTVTRFPPTLRRILSELPNQRFVRLKDVFREAFLKTDEELLHEENTPGNVQLNMTALMLRRQENLLEDRQADPDKTDAFISAAMECMELSRARAVRRARARQTAEV